MVSALKSVPKQLRLDLGAGKGLVTPKGFVKVDLMPGKGIEQIDLTQPWPWADNSVDEARAIYLIHYFKPEQRIHFVNELWRVLKPLGTCEIHTPHWASAKAFGDLTVQFPPVSEWWYPMLSAKWRDGCNFNVEGYTCDFEAGIGYGMHPAIITRSPEYQQDALRFYKEAAQDLIVTLTALK